MFAPEDLYEIVDQPRVIPPEGTSLVLVHALDGFLDAGSAGRLAAEHLIDALDARLLVRFDSDLLVDYRERRPRLVFAEDHYEDYDRPLLAIHELHDSTGTPFLLLAGPEPDVMWERFAEALLGLLRRFGVSLVVGLGGVPMTVPHTRPTMITTHATRPALVPGTNVWRGRIRVPSSAAALLEIRLGEAGRDAMGFVAHIPHYLAAVEYPDAAAALLESVTAATGLALPVGRLRESAVTTRAAIDSQVDEDPQAQQVVAALETQYDATIGPDGANLVAGESPLPTGEDLGAELERFLAQLDRRDEPGTGAAGQ
jgi:proteasome assembly chaperone (PAC2) family protein